MKIVYCMVLVLIFLPKLGMGQDLHLLEPIDPKIEIPRGNDPFRIQVPIQNTSEQTIPIWAHITSSHHGAISVCGNECMELDQTLSKTGISLAPGEIQFLSLSIINNEPLIGKIDVRLTSGTVPASGITLSFEVESKLDKGPSQISRLYPNPAKTEAFLSYQLDVGQQGTVKVSNLIGETLQHIPLQEIFGTVKIDTQKLRSGIYLVFLEINGKRTQSRKLIIAK